MEIGIFGGDTAGRSIDDVVADARAAEADGFSTYALSQIFALDLQQATEELLKAAGTAGGSPRGRARKAAGKQVAAARAAARE